jgi:hypothetical protein
MKIIGPDGDPVEARKIEIVESHENWSIYKLEDGTVIRLKPVTGDVLRLEAYNEFGEPIYIVRSKNFISADVPDTLFQKT